MENTWQISKTLGLKKAFKKTQIIKHNFVSSEVCILEQSYKCEEREAPPLPIHPSAAT